jgi:hypothetical protein
VVSNNEPDVQGQFEYWNPFPFQQPNEVRVIPPESVFVICHEHMDDSAKSNCDDFYDVDANPHFFTGNDAQCLAKSSLPGGGAPDSGGTDYELVDCVGHFDGDGCVFSGGGYPSGCTQAAWDV